MKQYSTPLAIIITTMLLVTACVKDPVPKSSIVVTVEFPQSAPELSLDSILINFENTNTGKVYSQFTNEMGFVQISLTEGIYNIHASDKQTVSYDFEGLTMVDISGLLENTSIEGTVVHINLPLILQKENSYNTSGWVIKEVYYAGSRTHDTNKSYFKDQFIELYNNSADVLYADGISIGETQHNNSSDPNLWSSLQSEGIVVRTMYTIPGDGNDYPIEPGQTVLLAAQPLDHTAINQNSFDLSAANWQWYDNHSLAVDVPEVDNLITHYSYSSSIWIMHTSGYNAHLIFRVPNPSEYVTKNRVSTINETDKEIEGILIANDYILDAVETTKKDKLLTKSLTSALDISSTYCDQTYSAKSVRRKIKEVIDGRIVLQDTNDSDNDFIKNADPKPKMLE